MKCLAAVMGASILLLAAPAVVEAAGPPSPPPPMTRITLTPIPPGKCWASIAAEQAWRKTVHDEDAQLLDEQLALENYLQSLNSYLSEPPSLGGPNAAEKRQIEVQELPRVQATLESVKAERAQAAALLAAGAKRPLCGVG